MAVALAIADGNNQLRTGNKSMVIEMLSNGRERPRVNPVSRRSTLDINGQTSVVALGRPLGCGT